MPELLTTAGSAHRLEQLISGARERLILVSPYVQVPRILLQRLHDAAARGVQMVVVCREKDLAPTERLQLESVSRLRLSFVENVHAKCYVSERGVIVTSMNLYDYSVKNNREMGVYFDATEAAYMDAVLEVDSILAASVGPAPSRSASIADRVFSYDAEPRRGHCIRCRRGVPLDRERPFCIDCWQVWAAFGNPDYSERYCHDCGQATETTGARPFCDACYFGSHASFS